MTECNSTVADMSDDSLEKAISKCVNRLNELTDEQKSRKSKKISKQEKNMKEQKKFHDVAEENGKTIVWNSFGETFKLWDTRF